MKKFLSLLGTITIAIGLAGCTTNQKSTSQSQSQSQSQQSSQTNQSAEQLADLNYQNGQQAFINVNGGKSTLNPDDWKQNRVKYADLDSLNRTSTGNTAYLEKRNVASDSLRMRQTFYPTGWHQKFVNNNAIINRGHLIAYSLSKGISSSGQYQPSLESGDQNNPKNLFTQSAFSNQKVQTIYETMVRNALRNNKKVIYQVRPIFRGSELMARGVQLQAISTDKTLNFNVYLFNVQPGIQFDYATGRSKIDRTMNVPTPANAPNFNNSTHRSHSGLGTAVGAYGAYKTYKHYQKYKQNQSEQHSYRSNFSHRSYHYHRR
ncbi:DNA/RNA non-specific endonuclease [Lactobacillaceae bacterium Scapto_B20]